MNTRDTGTAGGGDPGYFYILENDAFNGKSKGFGFVAMRERSDAERACSALNGREIGGRKFKANIAKNVVPAVQ